MAGRVLPAARPELGDRVQPELYRSQVEMNTPVSPLRRIVLFRMMAPKPAS